MFFTQNIKLKRAQSVRLTSSIYKNISLLTLLLDNWNFETAFEYFCCTIHVREIAKIKNQKRRTVYRYLKKGMNVY